jgi:hypothetical protein
MSLPYLKRHFWWKQTLVSGRCDARWFLENIEQGSRTKDPITLRITRLALGSRCAAAVELRVARW